VAGLTGQVSKVTVTFNGFSHTWPADMSALLVGPTGVKALIVGQVGGDNTTPATNVTFTVDDSSAQYLPDFGGTGITNGASYRPTNLAGGNAAQVTFAGAPTSTPASPYRNKLNSFNGTAPNGTWTLYVVDSATGDTGSIAGGWSIDIQTTPQAVPAFSILLSGAIAAGDTTQTDRLTRDGFVPQATDVKACPGPLGGTATLFYDTYTFTNSNTVAVPASVTTTSACGGNIFTSAYFPSYSTADFCTNYLADAGVSPSANGIGSTFSINVNAGQTVTLVVNQTTAGTLCSAYSLLVEGDLRVPLAAGVSVSGHVFGTDGRPLVNAKVTLTDQSGHTRTVNTTAGGVYLFDDVETGQTYTLNANFRKYQFATQVLQINDSIADADFTVSE